MKLLLGFIGIIGGIAIASRRSVSTTPDTPASEPDQPGQTQVVEAFVGGGQPGQTLPLIILLHAEGSTAAEAVEMLKPLERAARVLVLVGRYTRDGRRYYVNPDFNGISYQIAVAKELGRLGGIVDSLVEAAGAVPTRAVVVGLGAAGGLAVGLGLQHQLAVRQAWGTGGVVPTSWVPLTYTKLQNLQRPTLRKLTFGDAVAVDNESAALAQLRGFDFSLMQIAGPPDTEVVRKWMLADLELFLDTP